MHGRAVSVVTDITESSVADAQDLLAADRVKPSTMVLVVAA